MDTLSNGFYILQAQLLIFFLFFFIFSKKYQSFYESKYKTLHLKETRKLEECFNELKDEINDINKDISFLAQKNIQWINSHKKLPKKSQLASILLHENQQEEKGLYSVNDNSWTLMKHGKWGAKLTIEEVSHWRPIV